MTTRLYEAMFLLDNQMVREDWNKAKAVALDLFQKHGAKVKTAGRCSRAAWWPKAPSPCTRGPKIFAPMERC